MEVWGDKEGVWDREGRKGEERRQRGKENIEALPGYEVGTCHP